MRGFMHHTALAIVVYLCGVMFHGEVDAFPYPGIVNLDEFSFGKIVTNDTATIVLFSKRSPGGDEVIEFRRYAMNVAKRGAHAGVLPCILPIYGNEGYAEFNNMNRELGWKLGIDIQDGPVVKLFMPGRVHRPVTFVSRHGYSAINLMRFTQRYTMADFRLQGWIDSAKFREIAARYLALRSEEEMRAAIVEATRVMDDELQWEDKKSARYSIGVMERIANGGASKGDKTWWLIMSEVEDELHSSRVTGTQAAELNNKLNLLSYFRWGGVL